MLQKLRKRASNGKNTHRDSHYNGADHGQGLWGHAGVASPRRSVSHEAVFWTAPNVRPNGWTSWLARTRQRDHATEEED